jgi:protein-S-isoprenylcysteine O-methyltransferase Ste14
VITAVLGAAALLARGGFELALIVAAIMTERFGDEFVRYRARAARLIPGLH